jgi:hypothetical protein
LKSFFAHGHFGSGGDLGFVLKKVLGNSQLSNWLFLAAFVVASPASAF